jgi:hypothetical protein
MGGEEWQEEVYNRNGRAPENSKESSLSANDSGIIVLFFPCLKLF